MTVVLPHLGSPLISASSLAPPGLPPPPFPEEKGKKTDNNNNDVDCDDKMDNHEADDMMTTMTISV